MFDDFIRERRYLKGVSEKTIMWYKDSFKAFEGSIDSKATIVNRISELKERGVKPISINTYLRCINAYFRWLHVEHGKPLVKIPKLREEQKVLQTLNEQHISVLIRASVKGTNLRRAHLIALVILSTGLRASEVLSVKKEDINFDQLTIRVLGKGSKERLVPFCLECRKLLFRHLSRNSSLTTPGQYAFGTRNNTQLSVRNFERDLKILGSHVGLNHLHPHLLRHSFACQYLRNGGNVEFLRRILGHTSISTTQRYLRSLGVEDLGAVHNSLSPLSKR